MHRHGVITAGVVLVAALSASADSDQTVDVDRAEAIAKRLVPGTVLVRHYGWRPDGHYRVDLVRDVQVEMDPESRLFMVKVFAIKLFLGTTRQNAPLARDGASHCGGPFSPKAAELEPYPGHSQYLDLANTFASRAPLGSDAPKTAADFVWVGDGVLSGGPYAPLKIEPAAVAGIAACAHKLAHVGAPRPPALPSPEAQLRPSFVERFAQAALPLTLRWDDGWTLSEDGAEISTWGLPRLSPSEVLLFVLSEAPVAPVRMAMDGTRSDDDLRGAALDVDNCTPPGELVQLSHRAVRQARAGKRLLLLVEELEYRKQDASERGGCEACGEDDLECLVQACGFAGCTHALHDSYVLLTYGGDGALERRQRLSRPYTGRETFIIGRDLTVERRSEP